MSDVFVLADSLSVLSADTGGVMKLWDAEHGTTRLSITGPVGHLCVAPNSQLAVSGDLHDTRLVTAPLPPPYRVFINVFVIKINSHPYIPITSSRIIRYTS